MDSKVGIVKAEKYNNWKNNAAAGETIEFRLKFRHIVLYGAWFKLDKPLPSSSATEHHLPREAFGSTWMLN